MSDSRYQVLNEIMVEKKALLHNYQYFSLLQEDRKIAPVIKSNAYGHGLVQVARFFDDHRVPIVCVDSLYEAYELYRSGIKTSILIMGYTNPVNYNVWKNLPFIFGISDIASLHSLAKYQPGARMHIKVDTGMCRLGIREHEADNFIRILRMYPSLKVEGIYSHLSQADDPGRSTFTGRQIQQFKRVVRMFESAGFQFTWKHIAATAGAEIIHDAFFNLARVGIGLYGYSPFGAHTKEGRKQRKYLEPALTFKSHIALVKQVRPGDEVGYGGTYKVKQKENIAILPVGYNEGVSRLLSNCSTVLLNGKNCLIAGRVSMNMTTVKIIRSIQASVGDEVIIISPNAASDSSVYRIAQLEGTIPYTVLTALHPSIRRRFV